MWPEKGKSAVTFDRVTLDQAVPYACEDADITLRGLPDTRTPPGGFGADAAADE